MDKEELVEGLDITAAAAEVVVRGALKMMLTQVDVLAEAAMEAEGDFGKDQAEAMSDMMVGYLYELGCRQGKETHVARGRELARVMFDRLQAAGLIPGVLGIPQPNMPTPQGEN